MEDNAFWLSVVKYLTIGFIAFVSIIGGCTVNKQRILANMVESGAVSDSTSAAH